MTTNFDLKITVDASMVNGQIYFHPSFNRTLTATEKSLLDNFKVNLSRGSVSMYRLDELQNHNGRGANWTDGQSIHSAIAQSNYRTRVGNDVAKAWAGFKAAVIAANQKAAAAASGNAPKQLFFAANGS